MSKPLVPQPYPWVKFWLNYWVNDVRVRSLMLSNKKLLAFFGLYLLAARCGKGGKLEVGIVNHAISASEISSALFDMIRLEMSTDEVESLISELIDRDLLGKDNMGVLFITDFNKQQDWDKRRDQCVVRTQKHRAKKAMA